MKVKTMLLGEKVSKEEVSINAGIFGLEVRNDILNLVLRWQLLKRMSGNHKTKTMAEIRGGKAKPYKQKGTGNARLGNKKASQMRGGVTVFGPVVRDHKIKLPKKVRKLGLKIALSSKVKDGDLAIISGVDAETSKTSVLSKKLISMGISDKDSALMVVTDEILDSDFKKSSNNLKNFDLLPVGGLNVYDILNHKKVFIAESAIELLEKRLS